MGGLKASSVSEELVSRGLEGGVQGFCLWENKGTSWGRALC